MEHRQPYFVHSTKFVYNTTAGSRLGLFSLAERNLIDQWKYSVKIRSAVVMSTKDCKLKMAVISGSYFVKYSFWSIVLLRNRGQKNATAQLFIMIFPISLGLLRHLIMPYYREAENMFFWKKLPKGGYFFWLKIWFQYYSQLLSHFLCLGISRREWP